MDSQAELPHALLAHALDTISEGSIITDANQWIIYANAAFLEISGYTMDEIRGLNCRFLQLPESDPDVITELRETIAAGGVFRGEILNLRKNGEPFWNALTISPLTDESGKITHFVSVQRDVTEQIALRFDALHDRATGLPNRIALSEHLAGCFGDGGRAVSLVVIDLDDFKRVNETFGHAAGDDVLREFARRATAAVRGSDLIARVGGDEFALVIDGCDDLDAGEGVHSLVERVRKSVERPYLLPDGQTASLRMSAGIAVHPIDGSDELALFRKADSELYEEKSAKDNRARWWNLPRRGETELDAVPNHLAQVYRQHLADGALAMYMQPIVDLRAGRVTMLESLARLVTAGGEIVTAAQFVPMLDDGELERLFRFGIHQTLSDLARWDAMGAVFSASVNLDPSTLLNPLCASWVHGALQLHGIAPERLVLELLETRQVDAVEQHHAIDELRRVGVRFAIDDLGSGYSNLRRLSHFDFDIIKIDAGMLAGFRTRPLETLSLLSALTQLSQDLGRPAVVEGIEDLEMAGVVNVLGAPLGQGYLFAHPMPSSEVIGWLNRFTPPFVADEIRTYSAALAFHWRHGRDSAHAGWLEDCALTSFLRVHANGSLVDTWHARQHDTEATVTTAGRIESGERMMAWLAARVTEGQYV